MGSETKHLREFGKFCLDVEKKLLWHDGKVVTLPLKEIELLCALTESGGEVVTKDELLGKVWAESFVEESNLTRHIYRLRQAFKGLGEAEELIQTVPRRGYRFSGGVRERGSGELIIEKHSMTRTVIEELPAAEPALPVPQAGVDRRNTGAQTASQPRLLVHSRRWLILATAAVVIAGAAAWRFAGTRSGGVA